MYMSYKSLQWYLKLRKLPESEANKLWKLKDERNSKRLYDAIVSLLGLWVKAGQYLSTRGDVLPDAYISILRTLQDAVPEKPLDETKETICQKLKIDSLDKVFKEFDPKPLATASIAQVHRAKLLDGRQVVVKVQHKNIREKIMQDLVTLNLVIKIVAYFEPDFDFRPIVSEWCNEVPKELDFIIEAKNMTEVKDSIKVMTSNSMTT